MKRVLRKLVPNTLVNIGKHFPEALIANAKYRAGKKMTIIGVTGTDGKTTTVNMIYQVLKAAGKKVSMVSTINAVIGDENYDTGFHVTSPRAMSVQRYLKQAQDAGSQYMVLEVTSHSIAQFRFWGIKFNVAVITNVTPEHLDYHKSFKNYLKTKSKLVKKVDWAILNKDDKNFKFIKSQVKKGKVFSVSWKQDTDLNQRNFPLKLQLPGQYNLSNAMQAAGVATVLGIDKKVIKKTLENFKMLPGRMEEIANKRGIKIIVDFAHTPNALDNVLQTLKKETKGKLITVFGCASERDVSKREVMGAISAKLSDITILTAEDPRFEDPMKIIDQIAKGFISVKRKDGNGKSELLKESDRQSAINLAISLAKKGDTVGIYGKGHEKSMNYKGKELPWSDQQAVELAIKKLSNGSI